MSQFFFSRNVRAVTKCLWGIIRGCKKTGVCVTFLFNNVSITQDETSKSSSTANELGLANVGGVFVVLMGGMGVACVIAVCEFVWKSRKVAVDERVR